MSSGMRSNSLSAGRRLSSAGVGRLALARVGYGCRWAALAAIRAYRLSLGVLLAPACRFEPSCSRYAEGAVRRYGVLRGGWLALRRLLRCHPFHPGGLDPVP